MRTTPVELLGGYYTDESLPWSCQDAVNYIPVAASVAGTRTATKLVDAPGLRPYAQIGTWGEAFQLGGPIRGLHDVEGRLFAVCGTTLYQISNKGVAIPLGTIPGTGRVSMAHNQITNGNQLIVVNGSSGYVWNTVTETFARVVDASYPGALVVEFIDGYLMQLEPFGRFILHSDLADALAYNALDRFEAETAPDMTAGLAILHQEVWALGERTIDVFENVGSAQGTFRNKGVSIAKGCLARWSTGVIDNGLAWLGHDGVVYHARGYDPVRISTRAVEVALAECSSANLAKAFAFVWEDRGHAVYYLTVPNGPTFGYDFSTGLWHRRASHHPVTDVSGRWRLNDLVRHNGQWIGGDFQNGRLYALDWDYMLEGYDGAHVRERVGPVAHNDQNKFTVDSLEIIFDTGGPETVPVEFPYQPVGPAMSGSAPDGQPGDAYEFAYTVTPGDAPIARTLITSGELLAGLSWDQSTATISGTPTEGGTIPLTFRTVDTNGLYADHEDVIRIDYRYDFVAVSGSNLLFGRKDGEWADSVASAAQSGARVRTWGKRIITFGPSNCRYSDDYFATDTAVTPPWSGVAPVARPLKLPSGRLYVVNGGADVYYSDDGAETWQIIESVGTSCRNIDGDEDAVYVLDGATLRISTDGTTFPDSKSLPRDPTDMAYRDGVLMFADSLGAASFKTEDGGNSFQNVTSPPVFECYSTFATTTGRWLFAHRINTDTTNHLIGRLNDAEAAISYVITPSANLDGGAYDIFAERDGAVVSAASLSGLPPFMCILQSDPEGLEWARVDHEFSGATPRPSSIAAFPTGPSK